MLFIYVFYVLLRIYFMFFMFFYIVIANKTADNIADKLPTKKRDRFTAIPFYFILSTPRRELRPS